MMKFFSSQLEKFKNNEFVKNVFTLVSGTSAAQIIPILISPVLTRIYSPDDFAVLGIFTSVTLVLSEVVSGKFEMAIMNSENELEQKRIVGLTIVTILFCTSILLLTFIFFYDDFYFLQVQGFEKFKFVLILTIALTGFNKLQVFLNLKNKEYKNIAYAKVTRSLALSLLQLGMYFLNYLGLIIGYVVAIIVEIFALIRKKGSFYELPKIGELKNTLIRFKKYPIFEVPSSLLNIGAIQAPVFMIPNYFGSTFGGLYFQAFKVLTMPVSLVGSAVGQVFFEQGSVLKDDKSRFSELVLSLHKKLLLVAVIPFSVLFFFGNDLFGFVFGNAWRASGQFAVIMTPWLFFNFLTSPISFIVIIMEKQNLGFIFIFLMSSLRLIGLSLGIFYFNNLELTIIIFSTISAFSYIMYSSFLVRKFLTFSVFHYWFLVLKYTIPVVLILTLSKLFF